MPAISVEGLRFRYPSAAQDTLRGLSFAVEDGEIFGFLGPSGAGKSTTQRVLLKLLQGFRGSVSVLGRDLSAWGPDLYESIGVSFELPNHYLKLTARENLQFFRALYQGKTEEPDTVLSAVGLSADADKRVGEYSKGMRMRLNLARALIHNPQLLFLDEPTSGLDPVHAMAVRDLILAERARGRTLFLTTHDMVLVDAVCDRVGFVVDGELKSVDSPRALKLKHGRREVVVELKSGGAIERRLFPLDGIGRNDAFAGSLRDGDVQTIHSQETTLDKVFATVTGANLT
jgi:fluoroquinolone transport system ATP-binding protein